MRILAFVVLAAIAGPALAERVALVSDLNGRYGSTEYNARVGQAIETIVREAPDLVLSTGDMVAGQAPRGMDDAQREAMWASFQDVVVGPLQAADIPLAVTVGNHDGSAYPGFEGDRDSFDAQWLEHPPAGLLPGSEWPWRYALRKGGLLAITFDGTLPGAVPGRERDFVRDMLDRFGEEAEWTVVFSHLPFWPLAQGREREILDDPEFLALLHDRGVDVYASGHHHLYHAGLDEAGMVHLSVGALGGNARAFASGGPRQPYGYAELIRDGDRLTVRARNAPDYDAAHAPDWLPERVEGPPGVLGRLEGEARLRP